MTEPTSPAPRRRAYKKPVMRGFGSLAQVTRAVGTASQKNDMSMQGPDKTA